MPSRRNSGLLQRAHSRRTQQRTLNLPVASSLVPCSDANTNAKANRQLPSPNIPFELLDLIIDSFVDQLPSDSNARRFALIAPFTLTSRILRRMVLRRFFHDLRLMDRKDWKEIFQILTSMVNDTSHERDISGFPWVRTLYAPSRVISSKAVRLGLSSFSHLRKLFIDFAQEGLSTQHPTLVNIFSHLDPMNACPNLTSMTLTSLPRIDCLLLGVIAKRFPRLVDLYMSCTERIEFGCCWACFEDSLGCSLHSPVPDDYLDASEMASAFGMALNPLEHLEHLHLGVFLSDDSLLSTHISHVMEELNSPHDVQNWSDCRQCMTGVVADVRRRELDASIIIGRTLKALKTIGWSSLVTGETGSTKVDQYINSDDTVEDASDEGIRSIKKSIDETQNFDVEDQDMKTTIWISRAKGRIRVRRVPW